MEGAEAAIVTCTAHTPYTTFQLTQVTPSFLGPEIMCWPPGQANIIRRWHLHKCHYFTGSASRFNPCHKQNTDKEPVGMCAYICMYISILNTTALQKKKEKKSLENRYFLIKTFQKITSRWHVIRKQQERGQKTRVRTRKLGVHWNQYIFLKQ